MLCSLIEGQSFELCEHQHNYASVDMESAATSTSCAGSAQLYACSPFVKSVSSTRRFSSSSSLGLGDKVGDHAVTPFVAFFGVLGGEGDGDGE
mmetsp:Transcript_39883/g.91941  ORF Transcript_39883/g.91941 Transcript_39883/m.91941 type:complete len:93 (-) Transcript_39883:1709-1987(-)